MVKTWLSLFARYITIFEVRHFILYFDLRIPEKTILCLQVARTLVMLEFYVLFLLDLRQANDLRKILLIIVLVRSSCRLFSFFLSDPHFKTF